MLPKRSTLHKMKTQVPNTTTHVSLEICYYCSFPHFSFFNIYSHGSQLVLFSRKLEDTLDRDRLYLSLQKSLQPRTSLVKNISQLYCGTFTWRPFTLINTKWVQQWGKVVDLGGEKMGWHTGTVNVGSDVAGAPHCQAHLRPLNSAGDWCEHCCELKVPYSSFSRKLHPVHRGVWHCFIGDGGKKKTWTCVTFSLRKVQY